MARNSGILASLPDQDLANPMKNHRRSQSNWVFIHPNHHQEIRSNKIRKAEEISMIQKVENNKKMKKMLLVDQMTNNINVPDDYREFIESHEDCRRVSEPDTISVAASNDAPPPGATTDTDEEDRKAAYNKRSRSSLQRLSDQRRREEKKIKKKMRALQELLPGSNKVDKASILDEAIEYVKTLQHQLLLMSIGAHLFTPPMMLPPPGIMLVPTMNWFFGQAGPVPFPSMPLCMGYVPVLGDQSPLLRSNWATTSFDNLGCFVPPSSSNDVSSNPK